MAPIRLTDEQLDAVFRAARPLRVADRDAFPQEVARALQGQDLGDGAVYRAIVTAQKRHWESRHSLIMTSAIARRCGGGRCGTRTLKRQGAG